MTDTHCSQMRISIYAHYICITGLTYNNMVNDTIKDNIQKVYNCNAMCAKGFMEISKRYWTFNFLVSMTLEAI